MKGKKNGFPVGSFLTRVWHCVKNEKAIVLASEFCDTSSVAAEEKTLDRLPILFNDILLPSWYSQLKWCGIVFGSADASQIAIQGLSEDDDHNDADDKFSLQMI